MYFKLLPQGAVSCLHMVHTFHLAGFPKGLISAVTGKGADIGDFLTTHPGINCIRLCSSHRGSIESSCGKKILNS
jgi:glyceraldehyde-3-phosphate dehydrogenase (NADP+)